MNLVQSSLAQAYLGKLSDATIDDFESSCEETKSSTRRDTHSEHGSSLFLNLRPIETDSYHEY